MPWGELASTLPLIVATLAVVAVAARSRQKRRPKKSRRTAGARALAASAHRKDANGWVTCPQPARGGGIFRFHAWGTPGERCPNCHEIV